MDIAIIDTVPCEVAQAGATTAPVHTLYDIVRKLPEGAQVELDTGKDASQLILRAGRSRFTLACLPKEDFPAMTNGDLPHQFMLPAGELRTPDRPHALRHLDRGDALLPERHLLHATEADGVKVLRAVATDGHRLARIQMPLPEGAAKMPGVIVPRKAVNELRKLIDETTEPVEIACPTPRSASPSTIWC